MNIHLQRQDARWKGYATPIRAAAKAALQAAYAPPAPRGKGDVALTLLLTNDAAVQVLNHDYRGKDKPTNVLSFPDGAVDATGIVYLGDIALAYETIAREADEQGKAFAAHLSHLVIHGVLHLLGYDHETPKEAARMESLEITLLNAMGIANPYKSD